MEEMFRTTTEEVPQIDQEVFVKPVKVIFKSMRVGNNCEQLNVRKEASLESGVLRVIPKGTLVNVNLEKSTDDFYYVASEIIDKEHKTPIHGFCKKDYLVE